MARDYGHKRQARQHSSAPKQLGWVVAAFLGGYLTATIFDFTSLTTWVNSHILSDTPSSRLAVNHKAPPPKPKFEFYTMLSKDAKHRQNRANEVKSNQASEVERPVPVLPKPTLTDNKPSLTTQKVVMQPNKAVALSTPAVSSVVKPAPKAEISNKGQFSIQVAALKTWNDAEKVRAKLILKGFNTSISSPSPANGPWFRVYVGPYASHENAMSVQKQLSQQEHLNGMIKKIG